MQLKKHSIICGAIAMGASSLMTGCIDSKYDLTDIDKTTRVSVNNLTVPINLSEIKLDKIINLDDNENITKIEVDGKEVYAIQKGGDINTSDFSISRIHAPQIPINDISFGVTVPNADIISGQKADISIKLPEIPLQEYNINISNIDSSLLSIDDVKTVDDIKIDITLSLLGGLMNPLTKINFSDLAIRLPWGLITNTDGYDQSKGSILISELSVDNDGKAHFSIRASGITLEDKGIIKDHAINISDVIGIESGVINISTENFSLPEHFDVKVDCSVSAFDIASFSGNVSYNVETVEIAPIALSGLPDFLDSPDTEIRIADPAILVNINNPVGEYGLEGKGVIKLTSNFPNGGCTTESSDFFSISESGASLAFGTAAPGFQFVPFNGLGDILTNKSEGGLPESITVNIDDIVFSGKAIDFPIGNLGNAVGDYEFTAPLGFAEGSRVIYESNADGWSSEDVDKIYIQHINLKANCTTDIPVGILLSVVPLDKAGNEIAVNKNSASFNVSPMSGNEEISLSIEGTNGPIHGFDGVRFKAVVSQDGNNTQPIGPEHSIRLDNLRISVDGYYETDFE